MLLEGSCHCRAVRFRVEAPEPYPFMYCYCSICRKTAGGGGYAINLGALSDTLVVEGEENLRIYNAKLYDRGDEVTVSEAERTFCGLCGSALWVYDPNWPELVHPFASAVDTPLPRPHERDHIMLDFAAPWCEIPSGPTERQFPQYPDESLADWHVRHGLHDAPDDG
jgi:hypothetical protein